MGFSILSFLSETFVILPVLMAFRTFAHWKFYVTMKLLAGLLFSAVLLCLFVLPSDIILLTGGDAPNCIFYYNWQYIVAGYIKFAIYFILLKFNYQKILILTLTAILTVFVVFEFKTDSLIFVYTASFITNVYLIVNLFVVVLSLMYAYQLLQDLTVEDITKYAFFWLNSGFLIYHIGSISVYAFVGNGANEADGAIAWVVNSILLFLLYITITLSYYYSKNLPRVK